jgi:hypothetical protein
MENMLMEIVVDFLNCGFYYSIHDKCVFSVEDDYQKIGYQQIENIVSRAFQMNEDWAHAITFNWLLAQGVPLVRKNWNKTYLVHNIKPNQPNNQSITNNVDFTYKIIPND